MFKKNIDTYLSNNSHKPDRVVEYLSASSSSRAHIFVSQYRESDDYATLHNKPLDKMTITEMYAYVLVRKATDSKYGLAEKLEETMNSEEYHALSSSMQYNLSIMLLHLKMLESVNYTERCVIRNKLVERLIKRKNDKFINLSGAQLELIHVVSYNGTINLFGADLSGANLNHSEIANQDLRTCNLSNASLQYAKLYNVNLSHVSLKEANLNHATLSTSNLISTDLTHANLSEACFSHVILSNAKLNGTQIEHSNIESSYLDGISILSISQYSDIEDVDHIISALIIELNDMAAVIHKHPYESQFRKAVARDIKTIIENVSCDLNIQLQLVDKILDLSHPIFEHRSTLSKNMNIALKNTRDLFFISRNQDSAAIPTSSQKILINFRNEIIEQINNELKEEPKSGFSINY